MHFRSWKRFRFFAVNLVFDSVSCRPMPPLLRKVTLQVVAADMAHVRFAFSPLWECVAAFRAWQDPARHALLLPWVADKRQALAGVDWEPLASLLLLPRGTIPDFLAPTPTTPLPNLSEELANLRRVPSEVIRAELSIAYPRAMPQRLQIALDNPGLFVAKIVTLIEEFWSRALAPDWSVLRSKLEGEVLFRARALALGGLEELFRGLHRDVKYSRGRLTIRTDSYWDGKKRKRGIILVPSIFAWPDVFLTVRPPWHPSITYPSRGVAEVWADSGRPTPNALALLVGDSCAKVLVHLRTPRTTLEIARVLKLSSAAASEQITKLWRTGILERTRIGRRVFYSVNEKGQAVLSAFHA